MSAQRDEDPGLYETLKQLPGNVWRSVFRNPLPSSDLGRSQTTFSNVFLHIHPVKTHEHSLKPWYTLGLGVISFSLFMILTVTGILLMFYYVPSVEQAHNRMLDLNGTVAFGILLRNMHRWSAHGMVAIVLLHLCRVFYTGSYKKPREFNWVVGVVLLLLTLGASFTGYLLPWDQLAYWAVTVGTAIAGYAPIVGEQIRFLLLGDRIVGQEALIRFYVLHVAVIPVILTVMIAVHFWRIRKDGGLSRPEGDDLPDAQAKYRAAALAKLEGLAPRAKTNKTKTFGVMGVVRGPFPKVGATPENTVYSWPNLFVAELFCFALALIVILVLSTLVNAPLEAPANPTQPPNPSKAPWYFLGLQEMVSYSAFWGGVGVPTIMVVLLLLLPYIDRGKGGVGVWFSRKRLLATTLFTTILLVNLGFVIIGTFFRGANWSFVIPWEKPAAGAAATGGALMRTALAIISVLVLAIHGVVFHNQFFAPWQDHQKDYFKQAAAKADNELVKASLAARTPQIEQILVRNFGGERVDRCTTCHIAVEDPRFVSAAHPLRAHAAIPGHKFDTFGCTICHDGQGRAVSARDAHGEGEEWPWPLLPKELIQANCVQCHTEPGWEHAPLVNAGRRLFFERACYTCHTIAGLSYGSIGPELSDEGHRRRVEFVRAKILNPKATNPTSTMPKQDLTPGQVTSLVAFLKAQQGAQISRAPLTRFVSAQAARPKWLEMSLIVGPEAERIEALDAVERGRAFLPKAGCLSCHRLDDRDGRVGPDLAYVAAQRQEPWLMAHFKDPKSVVAGSLMPPYPLPDALFGDLSRYLLSRKLPAVDQDPKKQFAQLCSRCHGEKGEGNGVVADYLDPKPRDLTKGAFMRSKSVDRLVTSVRTGVPGTSMAPWGGVLGDEGSKRLVEWLLVEVTKGGPAAGVKAKAVPASNPVPFSKESVARGEATFLNRCWGCHGKKADGHGPNAADIFPRPRNLRNTPFVTSVPYTRLHESIKYGVQGTAMPAAGFDFSLDDKAIGDVINYIQSLNVKAPAPPAAPAKVAANTLSTR